MPVFSTTFFFLVCFTLSSTSTPHKESVFMVCVCVCVCEQKLLGAVASTQPQVHDNMIRQWLIDTKENLEGRDGPRAATRGSSSAESLENWYMCKETTDVDWKSWILMSCRCSSFGWGWGSTPVRVTKGCHLMLHQWKQGNKSVSFIKHLIIKYGIKQLISGGVDTKLRV